MTYTYKCKECEHVFDVEKIINDDIEIKCEKCNSEVRRIFKPLSNVWKTSGNFGVNK